MLKTVASATTDMHITKQGSGICLRAVRYFETLPVHFYHDQCTSINRINHCFLSHIKIMHFHVEPRIHNLTSGSNAKMTTSDLREKVLNF